MHLTFLGTGAATASPLPFCNCACCAAARREGGKNIRRRSSLLVGDELLIDLGPDTVQAAFRLGLDLRRVHTLLVTHAHADHFDPGHLCTRLRAYGCVAPAPLLCPSSPPPRVPPGLLLWCFPSSRASWTALPLAFPPLMDPWLT